MTVLHLCVVIDRITRKELASYEVEAADWYYARHIARQKFETEIQFIPSMRNLVKDKDWCVDSCEL